MLGGRYVWEGMRQTEMGQRRQIKHLSHHFVAKVKSSIAAH